MARGDVRGTSADVACSQAGRFAASGLKHPRSARDALLCFAKSRSRVLTGICGGTSCPALVVHPGRSVALGLLRPESRRHLALENRAFRQQLALLHKRSKRPRFGRVAPVLATVLIRKRSS